MMRETKADPNKWKDIPWLEDIVKISITPKATYRFNAMLSKFQWQFLQSRKYNAKI